VATLTVKVCEECGSQSATADGWLVIAGIDIRSAKTGEVVARIAEGTDLCSPGCLLRHISRRLEPAMNGHSLLSHKVGRAAQPAEDTRNVA